MEALEAIETRRSIRKYKSDPIDDKTVELVLEAGRRAPSWANTQCWRFIVVRDNKMKAKVADTLFKRPGGFENPATEAVNTVPVLIIVCAQMGKSGCRPDGEIVTEKGDWYMFDTALAVQNMVLAAHALGLGTVILGAFDAPRAAEILGVPDDYSLITLFPLGYPDEDPEPRPRKELDEIVFRDKFGVK
ncbi:MAG: nitroreductase [Dehalococcoidia bacterium]|nr:MAG: nitroreductase [Dehalococcoidia bacterium]